MTPFITYMKVRRKWDLGFRSRAILKSFIRQNLTKRCQMKAEGLFFTSVAKLHKTCAHTATKAAAKIASLHIYVIRSIYNIVSVCISTARKKNLESLLKRHIFQYLNFEVFTYCKNSKRVTLQFLQIASILRIQSTYNTIVS